MSALGRTRKAPGRARPVDKRPAFLAAKNLEPFISKDLERSTMPVLFTPLVAGGKGGGKSVAFGYRAELLPEVCKVFLDARAAGSLNGNQVHIAAKCEQLLTGLAAVGIIALVDEATGYQEDRNRDALHQILARYVNPELLPWSQRFPDEYYKQLFRLHDWPYNPPQVKRPQIVGKITNKIVYEKLPPGVLEELQKRNPVTPRGYRKHRHHQHLTPDVGNPHLEKQLLAVTTLMRAAPNWRTFERLFQRAFPARQTELEFDQPDDEDASDA